MAKNYVEFNVIIEHATEKAFLVNFIDEEDFDNVWVPRSCVEDNDEDFKKGYEGPMFISEWFCTKAGIEW